MFKPLVKQIDTVVNTSLPLPLDENILAWAALHGWDAMDADCQRLIVRQAVLNAAIPQTVRDIAPMMFATPLDSLNIETPETLTDAVSEALATLDLFNFWGEFYSALIPQSYRRKIGQFWTNEQIAEWMVSWLLQSHPRHLADIGCGSGNFLLKAAQRLEQTEQATALSGCDTSPLLLNVSLAAFLSCLPRAHSLQPTLGHQNFLEATLSSDADAVICNPPYTRHHDIAPALKDRLQSFFKAQLHLDVSRQGTLAFFFLLKIIAEMRDGTWGAVIVPMEVLDARYGRSAKHILCKHTTLSAIMFHHHRQSSILLRKIDELVETLLFSETSSETRSLLPLQLQLLEQSGSYEETLQKPNHRG